MYFVNCSIDIDDSFTLDSSFSYSFAKIDFTGSLENDNMQLQDIKKLEILAKEFSKTNLLSKLRSVSVDHNNNDLRQEIRSVFKQYGLKI